MSEIFFPRRSFEPSLFSDARRNQSSILDLLFFSFFPFPFAARQPAYLRDIYRMYASMTHGNSMRDLCQRLNPQNLRINERRLVQFGLIEGLIRRVYNVRQ